MNTPTYRDGRSSARRFMRRYAASARRRLVWGYEPPQNADVVGEGARPDRDRSTGTRPRESTKHGEHRT